MSGTATCQWCGYEEDFEAQEQPETDDGDDYEPPECPRCGHQEWDIE